MMPGETEENFYGISRGIYPRRIYKFVRDEFISPIHRCVRIICSGGQTSSIL